MPIECHCHAIRLSWRDAFDVVLTPQVVAGTVVLLFALSLLPAVILTVVLRYVIPKFQVLVDVNGGT